MAQIDWKKPEKVKLLRSVFVKEHGKDKAKPRKAGDIVTVSGRDKHELIGRGIATFEIKSGVK